VGLTDYAKDTFIAQHLSELTECRAPSLKDEFPERWAWLTDFILNSILRLNLKPEGSALAFACIRRVGAAIEDYEEGRDLFQRFLVKKDVFAAYFQSLRRFESAVAMTYQTFVICRKALKLQLFEKDDGTDLQRLNQIYNDGRHFDPLTLPEGHLHPIWLTNEGLATKKATLSFNELCELIRPLGRMAEKMVSGLLAKA
jgi:hypothetical protein